MSGSRFGRVALFDRCTADSPRTQNPVFKSHGIVKGEGRAWQQLFLSTVASRQRLGRAWQLLSTMACRQRFGRLRRRRASVEVDLERSEMFPPEAGPGAVSNEIDGDHYEERGTAQLVILSEA